MTAAQNALAGSVLTAAMLRGVAPVAAVKALDQSVTGTAQVNDNDLALTLPESGAYWFIAMLVLTGDAAGSSEGGLAPKVDYPSGAGGNYSGWGLNPTSTAANVNAARAPGPGGSAVSFGLNGSQGVPAWIMGFATSVTAGGVLQLTLAQNQSSSTATVVKAGSCFLALQIQ